MFDLRQHIIAHAPNIAAKKILYRHWMHDHLARRRLLRPLLRCRPRDKRHAIEQCVLCHNPNTTAGNTTVDFKVMVHRIHTGKELARPYIIGNTVWNQCNSSSCAPDVLYSSAGIRISSALFDYMMQLRVSYP